MKKAVLILLVLAMAFSMCACGSSEKDEPISTKSLAERVEEKVKEELRVYIYITYSVTELPEVTTHVEYLGDDAYKVTGLVSFRDEKKTLYTATYDADVMYLSDSNSLHVQFTLDTPAKSR